MVAINNASIPAGDHFAIKRYVRSLVQGTEFDELDFLRRTSRISPAELQRVSRAVADELQQELTVLVNDEFEGFVKLFNDIGDVGQEEFHEFEDKVSRIQNSVQAIGENAKKELEILDEIIIKLQRNSAGRRVLGFSLKISKELGRLETLLNAFSLFPDPLDLEIATETFIKVQGAINAASGKISIDESISLRMATVNAKFYSVLEDSLLICLRKSDNNLWSSLAGIYLRIEKSQAVSDLFFNEFLRGKLIKTASKSKYELLKKQGADAAAKLIFEDLLEMIKTIHQDWFEKLSSNFPRQHLFVDCVLGPVFTHLSKELSAIFSPALPDIFYDNFMMNSKFLNDLTTLMSSDELISLDDNEAFQSYARSWQLNVYYQLRFRDVAQAMEDALVPFQNEQLFNDLSQSTTTFTDHPCIDCLLKLCDEIVQGKMVLRPLRPKFLRLRLQMFGRVSQWLMDNVSFDNKEEGGGGANSIKLSVSAQAIWTHQSLVSLATRIITEDNDLLIEDIDVGKVRKVSGRFLSELTHRQQEAKEKFVKGLESWSSTLIDEFKSEANTKKLGLFQILSLIGKLFQSLSISESHLPTLIAQIVAEFITKSEEMITLSKKAVANYRRLKTIMKDSSKEIDQNDKEAYQAALFSTLSSEISNLIESNRIDNVQKDMLKELQSQLVSN